MPRPTPCERFGYLRSNGARMRAGTGLFRCFAGPIKRPGPRRGGRSARGRASTRRSRARPSSQKRIEAGSPPCSPQMPSFSSGFALRPSFAATPHEHADAFRVERRERVLLDEAGLLVGADEARGVVARDAEGGLRQVVGAEGEEVGALGDLLRRAARRAAARSSCRRCSRRVPPWPRSDFGGGVDRRLARGRARSACRRAAP